MPKDEAGSTPSFAVRIVNELDPSLPRSEGKEGVPAKPRCNLEPGAQLAVEVEFRRQDKVIWWVHSGDFWGAWGGLIYRQVLDGNIFRACCVGIGGSEIDQSCMTSGGEARRCVVTR